MKLYKFIALINLQRNPASGPVYKGCWTLWTKHSHFLWGLFDNCIMGFFWNGFGGLSPWWVGISKRTSKPARVICPGCQSALSLAVTEENWHCPAAHIISNKLVLLHESFYKPQDNTEMLVDSVQFCQLFLGFKGCQIQHWLLLLGGERFVWW